MPLNKTILSGLIYSNITTADGPPADSTKLQNFCDQLADAIVTHITTAAVVTVTGVQTGTGSAAGTVS